MYEQVQTSDSPIKGARRRPSRRGVLVCSMALCTLVLIGCSSKSDTSNASGSTDSTGASSSSTYPADKEAVCQARDQLKTSVSALTKPSLLTGGASAITDAVNTVQTDLDALKTAAKEDYKPQVESVQTSLQSLETSVGNLGNGSLTQNLQTVGTDIASVGTSTSDLFTQLKESCGS